MGKLTLPLLVAILLVTTGCCRADIGDLETLKVGLDSGKEIADFLKDKNFLGSLAKIASKASVFLSAISPALALVLAVIPGGESELERGFRELHNRLDIVSSEIKEVMELIEWESAKAAYTDCETEIRSYYTTYREAMNATSNETRTYFLDKFTDMFRSKGRSIVLKLLDSIIGTNHHVTRNLADASVKFTKKDRRRVQKFMMGLAQLVIKGAELEIAYHTVTGRHRSAEIESRRWDRDLQQMRVKMEAVDSQCESSWHQQSGEDLNQLLAANSHKSNKEFVQLVYTHLEGKFYWRSWFVVAYDEFCSHSWISSGDYGWDKQTNKQKVSQQDGHERLCRDGRNTVVASAVPGFDSNYDRKGVDSLNEINRSLKYAWAGDWYRLLADQVRGWNFKFIGIICTDCNMWYKSFDNDKCVISKRLEYDNGRYCFRYCSDHKRKPMNAILFY